MFKIEYPFSEVWSKGYLRECVDGRKRVDLYNNSEDRTTVSYARYLLAVKSKRFLTDDEEADHIDGDRTNDCIENLQILSIEEHKEKTLLDIIERGVARKVCEIVCHHCNITFTRIIGVSSNGKNRFCSKSCNAKFTKASGKWLGKPRLISDVTLDVVRKLREQGLSDYKISEKLRITRSTVYRTRKINGIP